MKGNERVYRIKFSSVYPLYIQKVEKKGRSQAEVDQILCWLKGYSESELHEITESETSLEEFFANASGINPDRRLITGVVCGIRVEDIEEPLMQEIRYMDKLIDELARGKSMEKILRSA